ncbi:hypothetical protein JG687_00005784 [Phytophthora cactorum]|uniref:Sulfite exporter TauE/SafE n=1 Tax=Phytophthora cactorum TaxID=29920 RepID=A0A8T1UM72_9STRA|nr:hypothetical protein JG687_00005784 [Phytophthora cactorum]
MRTWLSVVVALQVTSANTTLTDPELAPFYDTVGLTCSKRTECGYVPALACIEGKCEYCRPTAHDCNDHPGDVGYMCQAVKVLNEVTGEMEAQQGLTSAGDTVEAAYCVEKNLFSPFTYNDLLTTLIAFSCTALGAGGGVGVNRNRPLIDFGLVGLMEPTTLIGTVFGVMLNHIFPNWLILVLLVTLLSFITYKTILKGNTIQDKEDKLRLALIKSTLKGGPNGGGRGRKWSIYRRFDVEVAARRWLNKTRRRRKARLIREEDEADFLSLPPLMDHQPTSSDPLVGQDKRQFGTFSSDDDNQTQRRNAIERRNYPFVEGDIHWIKRRVLMFPAVCTTAGVAAGLLGIGGGMVKGPIMLEAGVLPAVQSATASFMILFTASSTTLQFAINGQFPGEFQFDYMAWFAFVGFLGGFCGLKCVGFFVKKYKRESIMVYMLATTIGLSALAMGKCEYCRPAAHDCNDHPGDVGYICQIVEVFNESTGEMEAQQGLTSAGDAVEAAYCVENNLFSPFTYNDLLTTLIAFSCTALGAGGGIGVNSKRPLIDFGLVGLMEPTTLVGTVFGVMLNHIFPNWLILVLLVTLLSFITYKTFLKGKKIQEKESKLQLALMKNTLKGGPNGGGRGRKWSIYQRFDVEVAARRWLEKTRRSRKARLIREEDEKDFESLPPLIERKPTSSDPLIGDNRRFGTFPSDDDEKTQRHGSIERRDARVLPLEFIWPLVVSWLIILVQAFLRGGHGAPSAIGVTCDSKNYWVLTLMPLTVLLGISLYIGHRLRLMNRFKVLSNYPFMDGDLHWIKRRVLMFPAVCTTAGVAAGLLGIGGGMVKGPIMLEAGVLPAVQSATASFMILFTASSTTLQFAINGQFPGEFQFDYMAWFAFVGFLGGFCGLKCVGFFVKKYKRESIMVYMLATTIGLSALAMGFIGLRSTLADIESGVHLGFHGICDNE